MNIYPYKTGSASAKALAEALGIKRIKHKNSVFKGHPNKVVINWGASKLPDEVVKCVVLNAPEAVSEASNKRSFFEAVSNHCSAVPFTTEQAKALEWLEEGYTVVARTILNGHSGQGIVLVEPGQELVNAPLCTKYIPKKHEYRVHVFGNEVIDVQRKARKKDVPDGDVNWKIRNLAGGFIFARGEDVVGEVPADVKNQAVLSVAALGLDFGAVDVIFNEKEQKAYVVEVNTAPGLTGTTLDKYVEAFKEVM